MSTLFRRIPSLSRASINETAALFAADAAVMVVRRDK